MDAEKIIREIVALDQKIAELRDRFDDLPVEERAAALEAAMKSALDEVGEDDPVPLALVRCADLLYGLADRAAQILAGGLEHPSTEVRHLCGECLLDLADEGVETVAPAIERALASGGQMAREMPFILALTEEEAAVPYIERFLELEDPEAVAGAIESLADLESVESAAAIRKLVGDGRTVTLDEDADGDEEWTVGQLAEEALEVLESAEEEG